MKATTVMVFGSMDEVRDEVKRREKLDEERVAELRSKLGDDLGIMVSTLAQLLCYYKFAARSGGGSHEVARAFSACLTEVVEKLAVITGKDPKMLQDDLMLLAEGRSVEFRVRPPGAPVPKIDPSQIN